MSHPAANIDDPGGQATLHDIHESDWSEFEVAELTWVNGQPRIVSSCSAWERAYAAGSEAGTLQSLVDGATGTLFDCSHYVDVLDPWLTDQDCLPARLDRAIGGGHGTCEEQAAAMWAEECKVRVGVDAAAAGCKRRRNDCRLEQGATESGEGGDPATRLATVSLGGNQAVLDGRDPRDLDAWRSFQDGRVQEANKEQASGMKDKSKKRNRIATAHNQSEKKRRAKFNQRMKTLQKLLPKSSKNDKVSILDDVISYTQKLQMQMQLMGNFIPCTNMMMPVMSQIQMQQLQMAMVAQYNMMARMSLSMGMNPLPNPSSVFPSFATRSNVTDLSSSPIAGLSWAGSSVQPNSADNDSIILEAQMKEHPCFLDIAK